MSIKLKGSSDGSVSFDAPADTSPSGSDITLTLPTSAGSANQFLKNSGIAGELEYSSMVETSTGVGIGTSPTTPLQVHSSTTASTIRITNSTSGATSSDGLIIQESGNDTYIWNKENSFISLGTNNAERARLDSSGRLLVGNTSSAGNSTLQVQGLTGLDARGAIQLQYNGSPSGSTTMSEVRFTDSSGNQGAVIGAKSASTWASNDYPGELTFSTTADNASSPTERMRIKSDGSITVGMGAGTFPSSDGVEMFGSGIVQASRSGGYAMRLNRGSNNGDIALFYRSSSVVGSISVTASATAYNTSSDYRLKENVVDLDGAIDRVKQLAPKRFNFIVDADTTVDGFLAHEAQTVVPEAVTGTHNEVDDDGNAVMQGIDQSKLVPLLTAALQEAIAKIETLETKVAALEAA